MKAKNETLDVLIDKEILVLDKGYVMLVDYMGNEESIVDAARLCYGSKGKTQEQNRRLIRRLWLDRHTSPFEVCKIGFHLKLPIFVARQISRHRTASLNEISARYTKMKPEFWVPDKLRRQSAANHQSSEGLTEYQDKQPWLVTQKMCYSQYQMLLEEGVCREQARTLLPVSMYTVWHWTIDLRNLMHFLSLRLAGDAQAETREYAAAMAEIVKVWVPTVWAAEEERTLSSE